MPMYKDSILVSKSKEFALRIIKFYLYLKDTKKEFVMSKQVLRSGTSIGANIAESVYAQSNADFVNKLSIAFKEASETKYWIELLAESSIVETKQIQDLNESCVELIKLLTSGINKRKNK